LTQELNEGFAESDRETLPIAKGKGLAEARPAASASAQRG
jgi:hypothetical protein